MFDLPEEYMLSKQRFNLEAFRTFLEDKDIFLYEKSTYEIHLDWWKLKGEEYVWHQHWWSADTNLQEALNRELTGESIFIAVNDVLNEYLLFEIPFEIFAFFSDNLPTFLTCDAHESNYMLFNECFTKIAEYDKYTYELKTNFRLSETQKAIEDTKPASWKLVFNNTGIPEIQQAVRNYQGNQVTNMEVWFPLKDALIHYHKCENFAVLEKLYACVFVLDDVTTDWPLWDFNDDLACMYYYENHRTYRPNGYRIEPGNNIEHMLRYVSEGRLWFDGIVQNQPEMKATWRKKRTQFVEEALKTSDKDAWKTALTILFCHDAELTKEIPGIKELAVNHIDKIKIALHYGYEAFYIPFIEQITLEQNEIFVILTEDVQCDSFNLITIAHSMAHQEQPFLNSVSKLRTNPLEWLKGNISRFKNLKKVLFKDNSWESFREFMQKHQKVDLVID